MALNKSDVYHHAGMQSRPKKKSQETPEKEHHTSWHKELAALDLEAAMLHDSCSFVDSNGKISDQRYPCISKLYIKKV